MNDENTTQTVEDENQAVESEIDQYVETKSLYVAPEAHSLRIGLNCGLIQFKNGTFETDDEQIIKELEELMKTNAGIKRRVKKVDRALGAAIVKKHQNTLRRQGVSGPFTSQHLREMSNIQLSQRDEMLKAAAGGDAEVNKLAEDLAKDGLLLTEATTPAQPQDPPIQNETKPNPFKNLSQNSDNK